MKLKKKNNEFYLLTDDGIKANDWLLHCYREEADKVVEVKKGLLGEDCFVLKGRDHTASYTTAKKVIASTKQLDGLPQLWSRYFFNTIGGTKIGVQYPDEHDSVMGYFDTLAECFMALTDWFNKYTPSNYVDIEALAEKEAEGRYPVLTHQTPDLSPYVGSKITFKHGTYFGYNQAVKDNAKNKWTDFDMAGFAGYYHGRMTSNPLITFSECLKEYSDDLLRLKSEWDVAILTEKKCTEEGTPYSEWIEPKVSEGYIHINKINLT
jgi:hypothetical protein